MSLAPLFSAPAVIQIHAFAAMAAFLLGLVQFAAPKGTIPHRTFGWIWVALMAIVAASAFFINNQRVVGPFGPIHLLALFVLVAVPLAVLRARQHRVSSHRYWMLGIYTGGMLIAGGFTFLPGRIMHAVAFGP
jgi:uncharacterized membrane protein